MKVRQQWFRTVDSGSSRMKIYDIALAVDGAGSLYFVGQQNDQDRMIFLTKMSCAGIELWRKQVSRPQDSGLWVFSIATDWRGNIYLTGTITAAAEAGQPQRSGILLAKFSSDGTELWQRLLEGGSSWGIHLAVDGADNLYLASGVVIGNNFDTWLTKISAAGDELWRRELGKQQFQNYAFGAVAADWAGNVCFIGVTERIEAAGLNNARVVKFSPDGTELWRKDIGTVMDDAGTGVGMDGAGNIYLAGYTSGEMAAGGGGPQDGASDGWLMKLAPDGTELWRKQMGTDKHDTIDALSVDGLGNIYLVGSTFGAMVADGALGGRDAWAARFSPSGAEQWRHQLGTAGEDLPANIAVLWSEGNNRGMAVDGGGNIYIFAYTVEEWAIKHAWLAKLYNAPESFEEMDELNRLRFQTLQQQISNL